jgi:hypothetical protein
VRGFELEGPVLHLESDPSACIGCTHQPSVLWHVLWAPFLINGKIMGHESGHPRGMLLDHTFGRASTNNKCNDFIPTNIANPKIAYLECKILLKPEHCVRSNQLITKVARGARPSWGHGGEQQPLGSSSNYRRKRIGNTLTNSATPLTSAACNGAAAETSGGN